MKKRFILVEIVVVMLIIAVLCAVMIPRFLEAQRNDAPRRLIQNLQILLDAFEQYQIDHGGIPEHVLKEVRHNVIVDEIKYSLVQFEQKLEQIEGIYHFFVEAESISKIPDFSKFNDSLMIQSNVYVFRPKPFMRNIIDIVGYASKLSDKFYRIENLSIHIKYPLAEQEQFFEFGQFLIEKKVSITSTKNFNETGKWMNPVLYYSPTNGLHSAGYIYVDSDGNHSPWK